MSCTVCLEPFTEPKVLPCCHTFCKRCLEDILEKAEQREKLTCPQCRAEHEVPSNGVKGFLVDYTVPSIAPQKQETAHALCESCDEKGQALAYCHDCAIQLCESCINSHKAFKFLSGHKIDDLPSDKPLKKATTIFCSLHPDKVLDLYCKSCDRLSCTVCMVASHNGHTFSNIDSDMRQEVEGQVKELASHVERKVKELEEDLAYIQQVEEEKVNEQEKLKDKINKSFDSLVATIEARRTTLLEEVESAPQLKEVWAQKELVETTIAASKSALSFATRSFQCTSDLEFLLLASQLKSRFKEVNSTEWDASSISTIEVSHREFSMATNTSELGKINSHITPLIEETATAKLGEPVTLILQGIKLNPQQHVRVLHSRKKIDVPSPVTVDKKKGAWSITFTPVVSGNHVIVVEATTACGKMLDKVEKTIVVHGEPEIGAKVKRGPDWKFGDIDGNGGQGIVIKRTGNNFNVRFPNGPTYTGFKWCNVTGKYDIQLML